MHTRHTLAAGLAGALLVMAGPALAGPCSGRIAQIEKSLSASDAGSGPTASTTGGGTEGGTVATTPRQVPKAGETPGTGGTPGMNATLGNRAASPADVRAQTEGQPTAAQTAQGNGQGQPMVHQREVSDALRVARDADARGDAQACGKALDQAESHLKG